MNSIRIILSLVVNLDWSLHQLVVSNAFLYGDVIDQVVFMEQPTGILLSERLPIVCLLHRVIYGLKQSPHAWFVKFSGLLTAYGFNPYKSDPIVMVKTTSLGYVLLAIYVDDIILTCSDETGISATKSYLQTYFTIRDLKTP